MNRMKIKAAAVAVLLVSVNAINSPAADHGIDRYGILYIDREEAKVVSPVKYGFHYEEIGMMGEGALHAELVRNRSFEEFTPPAGLAVKDGLYQDVPAPKGKNKKVYHVDPLIGWTTLPLSYSPVRMEVTEKNPLNEYNRYSLAVNVTEDIAGYDDAAILNRGYFGMNFEEGVEYRLSFFVRNIDNTGSLDIYLTGASGERISPVHTIALGCKDWTRAELALLPDRAEKRGMLAIHPTAAGRFQMDVVSLMPGNAWDGGQSVFRADIVRNLKEYSPDFLRFPGGCIVHGVNGETMYHWKKTIGPIENRPGQWSKWEPHYRTDGIGYHEFYELCEYIGADAMYVIPTGMICTGWVRETSPWNFEQPEVDLDAYIQDALDAIEYAIGGTDTKWGAERAKNGHPEPFPLKYIEIGNEDFGPVYWERYEKIYRALHAKYPDLVYIADSIIGKENGDKRKDIPNFPDPSHIEVFDEHHYQDVVWACREHYRFDAYERGVADLFVGELGLGGRYPEDILATAAVRISMERNGDLNPLLAERPLMRNWDFLEHSRRSNPMLWNGVDCSVKTSFYHISKMFRDNTVDTYYRSGVKGFDGMQKVFSGFGYDSASGEYVLKLLNLTDSPVSLENGVSGFEGRVEASVTLLDLSSRRNNTPDAPDATAPEHSSVSLDLSGEFEVKPLSLVIYRFRY